MNGFQSFRNRVNLLLTIDHAGRAGNGFFQTIFDDHQQVIACPWMHYVYSYILTEFGVDSKLNCQQIRDTWPSTLYFSLLYQEPSQQREELIRKMGGDPSAALDRAVLRRTFDGLLSKQDTISRHDLVAAIFYSYAKGLGRDVNSIQYILCTDSISLRSESVMTGFSGGIIDCAVEDFPNARFIHLERDPRAGLASSNHQFVNQMGNMYGLHPGTFRERWSQLRKRDFQWDSAFVFGFWLLYFRQTYRAVMRKRAGHPTHFVTVRNEDLNLDFVTTMRRLSSELGVSWSEKWDCDFVPTMLGKPWRGTGAYNNRYQTNRYGPLPNDPDDVASRTVGPNSYVTQRWRSRLSSSEILIIEALLLEEIEYFGYEPIYWNGQRRSWTELRAALWKPLRGELPTRRWMRDGLRLGWRESIDRAFYLMAFPLLYVEARRSLLAILKEGNIFELTYADVTE